MDMHQQCFVFWPIKTKGTCEVSDIELTVEQTPPHTLIIQIWWLMSKKPQNQKQEARERSGGEGILGWNDPCFMTRILQTTGSYQRWLCCSQLSPRGTLLGICLQWLPRAVLSLVREFSNRQIRLKRIYCPTQVGVCFKKADCNTKHTT